MKRLKQQEGYTILEVLIAATIFAVILIPMLALLGNVLNKYSSSDLILALNIAQEEMERTLHNREFESAEKEINQNNIHWKIKKEIKEIEKLLQIRIEVSRVKDGKVLADLYTEKYLGIP